MPRLPRIVVPGQPHHVTQRGNRRQTVFFNDDDYRYYCDKLFIAAEKAHCTILAWCLMPNHVHIILVPSDEDGLRATFAETHRQYTARINARLKVTGHLWQGRFGSVVMDEAHLWEAVRYVSLNPVCAGLVNYAHEWRWSSVRDHLDGRSYRAFDANAVLNRVGDFKSYLQQAGDQAVLGALRVSETSGRPLGDDMFIQKLEAKTGHRLAPQRRGPKRRI